MDKTIKLTFVCLIGRNEARHHIALQGVKVACTKNAFGERCINVLSPPPSTYKYTIGVGLYVIG